MKVFTVLIALACVGLCSSQILPSVSGIFGKITTGIQKTVGTVTNALSGFGDLGKVAEQFNNANSSQQQDIFSKYAKGFLEKYGNTDLYKNYTPGDITKNLLTNFLDLVKKPASSLVQFTLDNKFAGLPKAVIEKLFMGLIPSPNTNSNVNDSSIDVSNLPKCVDWRDQGKVSPVKDQGQCGCCWAFGLAAVCESRSAIHNNSPAPVLSEQNLVDCTPKNQGCNGGKLSEGYNQIQNAGGINPSASYPYVAKQKTCSAQANEPGTGIKGYNYTMQKSEKDLQREIALGGPVLAAVAAGNWSPYKSGVFACNDQFLNGVQEINHAVLVVGYCEDENDPSIKWWIVKNSWGSDWGENGYIRIARNGKSECGIAGAATYPYY